MIFAGLFNKSATTGVAHVYSFETATPVCYVSPFVQIKLQGGNFQKKFRNELVCPSVVQPVLLRAGCEDFDQFKLIYGAVVSKWLAEMAVRFASD